LPGLVSLVSADHRLRVLDETPLVGRDENERAWAGYFDAFASCVIYPHRIAENPHGIVTVLGHTTGSHLGLADDEKSQLTLIGVAECLDGAISGWTLVEDTPLNRERYGLGAQEK
jgi:hypothetical protein